jgi:hypothetical protein
MKQGCVLSCQTGNRAILLKHVPGSALYGQQSLLSLWCKTSSTAHSCHLTIKEGRSELTTSGVRIPLVVEMMHTTTSFCLASPSRGGLPLQRHSKHNFLWWRDERQSRGRSSVLFPWFTERWKRQGEVGAGFGSMRKRVLKDHTHCHSCCVPYRARTQDLYFITLFIGYSNKYPRATTSLPLDPLPHTTLVIPLLPTTV